jgi:hypothetical protein
MSIDHRHILRPSEPPQAGHVPATDPFGLWQLSALSPQDFAALGTPAGDLSLAQLRHLATYNLLAPTSHNTVPQRFLFPDEGNAIEICVDREVVLNASDPSGRQASISLGCGIANLIHAARRYGFEASVEVYEAPSSLILPHRPGQARYTRVARIRFRRGATAGPEGMLRAMLERRSVRADYNVSIALPAELAETLTRLVISQYPELEFHLVSDAPNVAFLADLQELADSTALNREDFAAELGNWLIENDSESPLGMRGREYGMSNELTRGVQARLQSEIRLRPEEVSGLAQGGNIGIRSSSAVGIIVVPRDDLLHRLLAGRAFEDLVLMLHQQAFVTAMHATITEIESANLALQARLGTRGRPIVVFRMGQPLEPRDAWRPHSARPSVSDVTLTESSLSSPPASTGS